MACEDCEREIKALKKQVRILQKKLESSEFDRSQLELTNDRVEYVRMGLIRQLESSQVRLENQAAELETALKDLKRLQAQIVDSEKMSALGTLVAGIAHEINNPVTFIQGNIEPAVDYCNGLLELILLYEKNLSGAIAEIEEKKEDLDFEFLRERSEEHTSELQSPDHLVCRLLLEKKKKKTRQIFQQKLLLINTNTKLLN